MIINYTKSFMYYVAVTTLGTSPRELKFNYYTFKFDQNLLSKLVDFYLDERS